jgi:lysyl-tRNA synthetase class II
LSIIPHRLELLAMCRQMLPPRTRKDEHGTEISGLMDQEIRYRQRYLDLIINENNLDVFIRIV